MRKVVLSFVLFAFVIVGISVYSEQAQQAEPVVKEIKKVEKVKGKIGSIDEKAETFTLITLDNKTMTFKTTPLKMKKIKVGDKVEVKYKADSSGLTAITIIKRIGEKEEKEK